MRITNQMMINSTMANVQTNKLQLNTLDNQLASQKKINKPSDDPVIAIRALRLRSSLDKVSQYLDKNIPDAESWLDTTEGAMDEAYSIIEDLYNYCNQGATDSYSSAERETIASSLNKLKEAYYAEGDVEYAGRYVFTGFMTDKPLNYQSDDDAAGADFTITQKFTRDDLDLKTAYTNSYTNTDILNLDVHTNASGEPVTPNVEDVHRIRIAYKEVDTNTAFEIKLNNGTTYTMTTTTDDNYIPGPNEAIFNATTGEILLGENIYREVYEADGCEFTYTKNNFKKADLNPVMYFDCVDNNTGIPYVKENEDVEYNVNFSQKLKVNTEAKDAFNIYLGRDIDNLITAVQNVLDVEAQIKQVNTMMNQAQYSDEASQQKLSTILEGLNKHKELAEDNMTQAFEAGVGQMKDYQQQISLAKADVGNRKVRLNLTKGRLTEQKANFQELKSKNEDIDLEEVIIGYSAAELVYNASLTAASKVVQQTLLDFL